jgi:hypothetical protein
VSERNDTPAASSWINWTFIPTAVAAGGHARRQASA